MRSLIDRIRSRFHVSVAEVEGQGAWQTATVGVSCVSGSAALAQETVGRVVAFIDASSAEFEVVEREIDTLTVP